MVPFFLNLCLLFLSLESTLVSARVAPNETTLIFYYGPEFNDSQRYKLSEAAEILNHPNFDKPMTTLYFHGHSEKQEDESLHLIVESYLKRDDINIITVDWAKAAGENYLESAFTNVPLLAPVMADVILNLFEAGLERKNLMVVSHSLGSQLAGMTGRHIIAKTDGGVKIHRMAALDAAYPFFVRPFLQTVSRNDADHLQVIHTDIGTYGQPGSLGHVDFWPNGGKQGQPGCPNGFVLPLSPEDLCSHQRSWRYWAESVANVNGTNPSFLGFPAKSYFNFLMAGPENLKKEPVEMGIRCPIEAKGDYYLRTRGKSPFAMGMAGY